MADTPWFKVHLKADGVIRWEIGNNCENDSYVDWRGPGENVTLDGEFSAAELRALVDHMDAHSKT